MQHGPSQPITKPPKLLGLKEQRLQALGTVHRRRSGLQENVIGTVVCSSLQERDIDDAVLLLDCVRCAFEAARVDTVVIESDETVYQPSQYGPNPDSALDVGGVDDEGREQPHNIPARVHGPA